MIDTIEAVTGSEPERPHKAASQIGKATPDRHSPVYMSTSCDLPITVNGSAMMDMH
jgi:hypothetical protein